MKKGIIKGIVLAVVFVAAVFAFSHMSNRTNEDLTREMSYASLPLVVLKSGGVRVNEIRGYTAEMDLPHTRDTITPIDDSRIIPVEIQLGTKPITGISYQIRSLDGKELLVDEQIRDFESSHGRIETEIPIQGIVDKETEYFLEILISDPNDTYSYITRIMESEESYPAECIAFAMDFHERALNPDAYETLATYLEPDSSGDNSTLAHVTINSSLKQVGWADFGGTEQEPPIPRVMELTPSYSVVLLDFVMTRIGDDGQTEYYNCEEYFRIRHTSDRDYLLNYDRTMNQIFNGEDAMVYGSYLQLGICDGDVNYLANESATAAAFVQEGDLWCYNVANSRLIRIFSFRGPEGVDERENYGEHDIKIVSIDEEGSVNFVVYGYMNRGEHEGKCGIGIYRFNAVTNTVEEEAFIPYQGSYQVLKSDIGLLMYENEANQFALLIGGYVYSIDLTDRSVTTLLTGLSEGTYTISESNRYLAYQSEGGIATATRLSILDFENGSTFDIDADPGEYLKPLGFMQEDLIYGCAYAKDIQTDGAGTVSFPMKKIMIISTDPSHEVLKEYSKPDYYVTDIYLEDYTIYLNRVSFDGITYVEADQDTIMNREGNSMEAVTIHSTVTEVKETEYQIDFGNTITNTSPKMITPKDIALEEDRTVLLNPQRQNERFFVYAKGKVQIGSDILRDAVDRANTDCGVVVGDEAEYLWKRARASAKRSIPINEEVVAENHSSISKCISALLDVEGISIDVESLLRSGQTPREILSGSLKDARFMDLTGCNVEEVLYYISCGAPVFALSGNNEAVLLVGYDQNSVMVYNPMTPGNSPVSFADADELFERNGNVFLTYLKQ